MFLKKFQGQYVEIVTTRDMLTDLGNAPLMVYGFVVDMDSEYLYLGENPIQISRALSREHISLVELSDPSVQQEVEMMGSDPESDEELN